LGKDGNHHHRHQKGKKFFHNYWFLVNNQTGGKNTQLFYKDCNKWSFFFVKKPIQNPTSVFMKKIGLLLLSNILLFNIFTQGQETYPLDTLNTKDKYTKVVLFSDYTWTYLELDRPDIDMDALSDHWDTEAIHAFKDVEIASLPDTVNLTLVDATHPFVLPIKGSVYSRYGYRRKRPHRGVDIPLTTGDSVRAAFNGVVRVSEGSSKTGGYGNLVIVRHDNGLETYYGHLSKILVHENEPVRAGEVIGLGGSTGRSTGPHLHFETRYMGKAFDPERVVDWTNGCLRDTSLVIRKQYYNINSRYGQADRTVAQTSSSSSQSHATSSANSSTSGSPQYYTVRKGDTLGKIAGKYHTTVSKLCKLNKIKETTILQIGRKLRVR
jgi:murein DD-endopeptidase MepM/ murein hydrolase activator NlpD